MIAGYTKTYLDRLPTELLRQICEYTLPQGLVFTTRRHQPPWSRYSEWCLCAAEPGDLPQPVYCKEFFTIRCRRCPTPCPNHGFAYEMHTALLYVNKVISTEAHAALYRGNLFRVYINAKSHPNPSLSSPLIFGSFGEPQRIHLTRDFRRIRMAIDIDDLDTFGIIRIRSRVQYFVDILNKHADDQTRKSLLKGLFIRFLLHGCHLEYNKRCKHFKNGHRQQKIEAGNRHIMRHMFTLEPLAQLHALEDITLIGCPVWFAECLLLRLRGGGGPLSELTWPTKIERRAKASGRYMKAEVSTRQCWQPVYDWAEFAERNNIAVPDEAGEFFP